MREAPGGDGIRDALANNLGWDALREWLRLEERGLLLMVVLLLGGVDLLSGVLTHAPSLRDHGKVMRGLLIRASLDTALDEPLRETRKGLRLNRTCAAGAKMPVGRFVLRLFLNVLAHKGSREARGRLKHLFDLVTLNLVL